MDKSSQDFNGFFKREERVNFTEVPPVSLMYPNVTKRIEKIEEAFQALANNEPVKASILKLIINTILFDQGKSSGGTSVNPNYIGVICVHHDMYAETASVPELLLHELTHNILFLDELRYQHYQSYDSLKEKENSIDSPYGDKIIKLPFDRVLHRMAVFIEVLAYRENHIGHKTRESQHLSSDIINATCKQYIADINNKDLEQKLLTTRGKKIYQQCYEYFSC